MLRIEVIIEEKDEVNLPSSATSSKTGNNVNGEHFGSVPTRFSMIAIETVTFGQSWHSPTHREFPWLFRGPAHKPKKLHPPDEDTHQFFIKNCRALFLAA